MKIKICMFPDFCQFFGEIFCDEGVFLKWFLFQKKNTPQKTGLTYNPHLGRRGVKLAPPLGQILLPPLPLRQEGGQGGCQEAGRGAGA